jgi:hypothetical protein
MRFTKRVVGPAWEWTNGVPVPSFTTSDSMPEKSYVNQPFPASLDSLKGHETYSHKNGNLSFLTRFQQVSISRTLTTTNNLVVKARISFPLSYSHHQTAPGKP